MNYWAAETMGLGPDVIRPVFDYIEVGPSPVSICCGKIQEIYIENLGAKRSSDCPSFIQY
jgi:hypothetical protein